MWRKRRVGWIAFVIVLVGTFAVPGLSASTESTYAQNSALFFPETAAWTAFDSLPVCDLGDSDLVTRIRSAYLKSAVASDLQDTGVDNLYDCSFIDQALKAPKANAFRWIDLDQDGQRDVIYSGDAGCSEGAVTIFWYGSGNGFDVKGGLPLLTLRICPGADTGVASVGAGCCDNPVDEYYVGTAKNLRMGGVVRTTGETAPPLNREQKRTVFENTAETVLRSSPEVKNAFDKETSGRYGIAVFGNILSKFLPGASGQILARQRDAHGRTWAYVLLTDDSDAFRYHSPYIVNVGWVASDGIAMRPPQRAKRPKPNSASQPTPKEGAAER